jgi:glycine hydroxymethyltransferase
MPQQVDQELFSLIQKESERQKVELELIPSENYVSPAVLQAMGSVLTNKYSEGYAGKRYYAGNKVIDQVETLAIERAKKLFGVPHVNVQAYSGSPANLAAVMAACSPGDTIMGLSLTHGGHLTHGWKVSASGIFYNAIQYGVDREGRIDFENLEKLAHEHKPKLIFCGATAYPYEIDFERFAKIADAVGAILVADIAHISGLVVGGVHSSPVPFAHIVTTTTHKTLRGPRGALIMATEKGLLKDAELGAKIDKAVFPGLQGGPHENVIAAIAQCLFEADTEEFNVYAHQVVKNSKALAKSLSERGFNLVGGGSENHLLLVDLQNIFGSGGGVFMQEALDIVGLSTNKNTVPGEPSSPFYPSGLRLGTPAVTTRGLKETDMGKIAEWIHKVSGEVKVYTLPVDGKVEYVKKFKEEISENENLKKIKKEIEEFAKGFPVPGVSL